MGVWSLFAGGWSQNGNGPPNWATRRVHALILAAFLPMEQLIPGVAPLFTVLEIPTVAPLLLEFATDSGNASAGDLPMDGAGHLNKAARRQEFSRLFHSSLAYFSRRRRCSARISSAVGSFSPARLRRSIAAILGVTKGTCSRKVAALNGVIRKDRVGREVAISLARRLT